MGRLRAILSLGFMVVFTLVLLPVQLAALRWSVPDPRAIPRLYHRVAARLLGMKIAVGGEAPRGGPLLIVANHASWLDIVVLGSLLPASFVARADMAGWPGVGLLARMQRSVFVDRTRRGQSGRQISDIASRLCAGDVVVLFPEGTTSDGNRVLSFNSSLFGAAREAVGTGRLERLSIQPVAIAYVRLNGIPMGRAMRRHAAWVGDEDLAPHLMARLAGGVIEVAVHFGAPVAFTVESDRKAVARALEEDVRGNFVRMAWGEAGQG
jgi:lyso-ornithine lipid O-acyltransferase